MASFPSRHIPKSLACLWTGTLHSHKHYLGENIGYQILATRLGRFRAQNEFEEMTGEHSRACVHVCRCGPRPPRSAGSFQASSFLATRCAIIRRRLFVRRQFVFDTRWSRGQ